MATGGEQQSTSDGIDKGGWWLARERRRGDHTTTTVGDDERRERAADDNGSDKEGEGDRAMVTEIRVVGDKEGEGDDEKDDVGDEGGVQRRGRWRRLQERWGRG
jgi:hypothetical protein